MCAQKAAHLLIGELLDGVQLFDASRNAGLLVPFVQFFERFGVPFIAISISFVLQALVGRTCGRPIAPTAATDAQVTARVQADRFQ